MIHRHRWIETGRHVERAPGLMIAEGTIKTGPFGIDPGTLQELIYGWTQATVDQRCSVCGKSGGTSCRESWDLAG